MPDSISKTQRWLDLIAFLIGHRFPVSVEQIMEAVPSYARDVGSGDPTRAASARRKFERDKDELRDMGIPIQSIPYQIHFETQTGYRLERSDFYLPYLNLLGEKAGATEEPTIPSEEPKRPSAEPARASDESTQPSERPTRASDPRSPPGTPR